jgi:putative transcriptional regulator
MSTLLIPNSGSYTVFMPQIEAKPGKWGLQPLKTIIRATGTTNAKVAAAVGCSTNQITMLANGQTTPSLPLAGRIARHFGLHIEELFSPSMLGVEEPKVARRSKKP